MRGADLPQSPKRVMSSSPTCRTVSGEPVGMLKMKYCTARRRQLLDPGDELVRRPDVRGGRLLASDLAEEVTGCRRLLRARRQHQRAQPAHRDVGGVAAQRLTVAVEDVHLVRHCGGIAEDVRHVGVAGHQPQGPLLATAPDEDGWTAWLHGTRDVAGLVDPVVAAVERRRILGEHGPADLQCLLQPVQPLPVRREIEAQAFVLHVVPGRADTEDGPPRAEDVERRHDLGQVGRVPVGDAGHHGAQPDARGLGRRRAEEGVGVEHGLTRATHRRQLVEVVHHPDRVVAGLLGRGGQGHHPVEEGARRLVGGEVGDLQTEAHAARTYRWERRGSPARQPLAARQTPPHPCAAWNARSVGSPGGGGRSEWSTRKPLKAATRTARMSRSAADVALGQGEQIFGIGTALQLHRRRPGDQVERRARRHTHGASPRTRPRPPS